MNRRASIEQTFMNVLDTNVISELMRDNPHPAVLAWLDSQLTSNLFVTAITEAEILTGIAILPPGKRRTRLMEAARRTFNILYAGRILPFDSEAANIYAIISAERRTAGQPISQADCQIAAIARSQEAVVATRNVVDFEGTGVKIINPWKTSSERMYGN